MRSLVATCALTTALACSAVPNVSRPPHHTDGGFRNPPGSLPMSRSATAWGAFFWRRLTGDDLTPNDVPPDHVVPREEAIAAQRAAAHDTSITWLGHAAFLIRVAGRTILTDPFLSERASPFGSSGPKRYVPPGIPIEALPPIDVVLISHNHYDHLDARTLERLPDKERIDVVVPLRVGALVRELGFTKIHELDWFEGVGLGGVVISGVPAIHGANRGLFDRNEMLWSGYAIEAPGLRAYFAGDTGYGPVFSEIGARRGPFDVALVPIGAYEPRELMRPVHVNPEEAVQVARDVGARIVVGMHWGTVVLTDEPPFEPPERFVRAAAAAGYAREDAWVMRIGETRRVPPRERVEISHSKHPRVPPSSAGVHPPPPGRDLGS